jgi:Leucine-rich repeat (LRR) protein
MIIDKSNYKEFLGINNKILHCSNRKLTEIRYLPESLIVLYCHNNNLTSLPKLPNSLERLYCDGNRLTTLPELPDSLDRLYCEYNDLPIQGNYYSKKQIKDYKHKLNQYNLINKILEKI